MTRHFLRVAFLICVASCTEPDLPKNNESEIVLYHVEFKDNSYMVIPPKDHKEMMFENRVYLISGLEGVSFKSLNETDLIMFLVSHGVNVCFKSGHEELSSDNMHKGTYVVSSSPERVGSGDTLVIRITNQGHRN